MSSISFFKTQEQADESTRLTSTWVRDEKLETALPNPPKITGGEVMVKKMVEKKARPRVSRADAVGREGPLAGLLCLSVRSTRGARWPRPEGGR